MFINFKNVLFTAVHLFLSPTLASAQEIPDRLSSYRFNVENNVSAGQLKPIATGIIRAEDFFKSRLGISLKESDKKKWVVKVVAHGRGNPEKGSEGSCCTAYSRNYSKGPSLFFDPRNSGYPRDKKAVEAMVVHEWTHGLQMEFGVLDFWGGPMGDWMEEGMAEYLAYEDQILRRRLSRKSVENTKLKYASDRRRSIDFSIQQLTPDGNHPWPGHMGYLAVAGLVETSEHGLASLIIYMKNIKRKGRARAFKEAFSISLDEFEASFEAWRELARRGKTRKPVWSRL